MYLSTYLFIYISIYLSIYHSIHPSIHPPCRLLFPPLHHFLQVGKVQSVLCLDTTSKSKHSYKMWMDKVESEDHVPPHLPEEDDIATIIYTSGESNNLTFLSFACNMSPFILPELCQGLKRLSSLLFYLIFSSTLLYASTSSSPLLFSLFYLIFSSTLLYSPFSSSPLFFSSLLPHLLLYSFLLSCLIFSSTFLFSSPLSNLFLFSFIILTLILPSFFDHSTLLSSFTFSGTTGNPKGVELSHKNLISNVKGLNKRWKVHTSRLS